MDDFTDLEADLRRLRPVAPSEALATRVERALAEAPSTIPSAGILPRRKTFRLNWLALGLGLSGATAFLFLARTNVERAPQKQPTMAASSPAASANTIQRGEALVPYGFTRVVYQTRDEGLLFPRNGDQPVRRRRAHSRETLQWKDSRTGASLRVSYPTEEVEIIPVSGQ
ncbi:MAG TPA: hypothetical protein VK474_07310 [Chthoniobacterales bacterium]|nr:hypothetical protein [Chthoniobacterales bacterium]